MLRMAIGFFVLALLSIIVGATGLAGVSMEIGQMLLWVFLVLSILSFLINALSGRGGKGPTNGPPM